MDVLRPPLININGRIYRRNIIKEEHYEEEEEFSYMGPPDDEELGEDETCDTHLIEQSDKGYRCAIDVPSVLYKYIIGKKGETRKRLEFDTKTSINIPKQGVEGQIVITGSTKTAVSSAVTRVEVLVENFRRKQPFTHFLSFPLNDSKIQEGFLRFKDEVLKQCSQDHGVEESIFQNPAKLHLTIGTLALLNEMEVRKACEHLQECQNFIRDITEGKPLPLEVTGIEYMNDDPAVVDVLYAKVNVRDGSDRLQVIADRLVEHFVSAGLMVREWDRVKLHGTVMNTLFRKDSTVEDTGAAGRQTVNEREAFDAKNILKKFDAYCFGEFELNTVQLSQRYSTDCTGYYSSAGSISLS
ncbi:activating signal cointegrator 1 complex subunit 1 [Maylandia zebra]|uniref:Activating signal cointegrator 1 complex subunit 1 n=3 Tax=Haplochromini TaxID=319058 RepID=A0A3P9AV35_9CICH|nr:activating signal cointegrator 1 complex subunit 1 [Maylandia zebra]XP_005736496.1 PREDICTED: activating signal cointegrator 1 complex subunit 1 [Pundamilia nyererei]XP_005736497.1 PREDICTED: activating signal cointegrator 1 complex subunit 1 [Pundamilia nyererei]XP_005736498.1 PREDICTED: activating signal cointegrator 1 complex subunit 1 [Pundamilia nyererei]XP_005736499.1 PREDICTED: activating signal cointegrator 1 complex subunit 1 [Pundamilia nyererei]XP_012777310.1 activating signal co